MKQIETWEHDIEHEPNLIHRSQEDRLDIYIGSTARINDPAGPDYVITWQTSPQCHRMTGRLFGYHVNGEFVWTDNPFWIGDLFSDLAVGQMITWEASECNCTCEEQNQ